ncbi:MFS transporter [Kitasatospora sp. NPDC101801]|uniref:MFS transporter n=1 Tax=Kitasatospora sp. NPDC101801 TaxID=3364103 RepID=UPI003812D060
MTPTIEATAPTPARNRLLHPDPTVRRLARITLLNCLGNGLSMTLGVLFFTRVLGFGAVQVGTALTAAGLCGVLAGVPAGRAADRWGSRRVLVVLVAGEALGVAAYTLVHSYLLFVPLACLVMALDRGSAAVRNALYAEVLPADRRVAGRAYLRVVTNVGIGAGTAVAALVLHADSRDAYVAALLADAVSFAVVAVMYAALTVPPRVKAPTVPGERTGNPALRNRPFLAVTVLSGLLCLQFSVLEVGVPLWVVEHTEAPRVVVAVSLIANTVLVALLQVRATRGTEEPTAAARIFRRGGLLIAAACLLIGLAHGLPGRLAAVLLIAGVACQTFSEMYCQAAGWALSYDLAGDGHHGSYQGVFNAGLSSALMFGPVLITTVVITNGLLGWILLGALMLAAAVAMPPTVRWAQRTRPDAPVPAVSP